MSRASVRSVCSTAAELTGATDSEIRTVTREPGRASIPRRGGVLRTARLRGPNHVARDRDDVGVEHGFQPDDLLEVVRREGRNGEQVGQLVRREDAAPADPLGNETRRVPGLRHQPERLVEAGKPNFDGEALPRKLTAGHSD